MHSSPRRRGALLLERSAIEDLYQAEGGDLGNIRKGPIPVAKLRALDARLLDEWKKQLVFLAKVRSLHVSCEAKIAEGGQEFARRYAELHSATWEAVDEVVGLPPPDWSFSRWFRHQQHSKERPRQS